MPELTAIDKYLWLEATGRWREAPGIPEREVIVSFRNTMLVLTDLDEKILAHWALAGMQVLGTENGAKVYSTTEDGAETLTISDPEMIAAIDEISLGEILPSPPSGVASPRRSYVGLLTTLLVLTSLLVFGPDLVRKQAIRMIPGVQAEEFGDRMLLGLMEAGSALCVEPVANRALSGIATAVDTAQVQPRIRVLEIGDIPVAALPGHTVLLNASVVTSSPAPEELAGWVSVALTRDPVAEMMQTAGVVSNLQYVFTGMLSPLVLTRTASAALRPPSASEIQAAALHMTRLGIDPEPFVNAVIQRGLGSLPADPAPPVTDPAKTIIDSHEQLSLTRICD